jgi:hypothetical protein
LTYPTLQDWVFAFDTAALDCLAGRDDGLALANLRVEAKACPVHGPTCVTVTFGELLSHHSWRDIDPAQLAAELLAAV